ncbi:MAG TPA: hypothetical protein VGB38_00825 [bacterium]
MKKINRRKKPQTDLNKIEIWFFIGALLGVYGLLILGTGIFHLFRTPARQMALAYLHPDVWWGALLTVIGLIYTVKFWPKK